MADSEKRSTLEKDMNTDQEFAEYLTPEDWPRFKKRIAVLSQILEKMRLADYIAYLNRPGRLLLINFTVGMVRGLGAAIGATVLAGLIIMLLKWLGLLNLPLIGNIIAELVRIVNSRIGG